MRLLWRIISFARPLGWVFIVYFLLILGATIFSVINLTALIPLLQVLFDQASKEYVPDQGIVANLKSDFYSLLYSIMLEQGKLKVLYLISGSISLSVLLANGFRYASQLILAKIRVRTIKNLRREAFDKVLRFDLTYFHNQHKGDFVSRLTVDVQDVEQSIVSTLKVIVKEPFLLIGYLIALLSISPTLTVYALILIPTAGFTVSLVARKIRKWSRKSQESVGKLSGILDEVFSGMRVIQAMNAQHWVKNRFVKNLDSYAHQTYQIAAKSNLSSPISEVMGVLVLVMTLVLGGRMVLIDQEIDASTFIGFLVIFSQLLNPAKAISVGVAQINKGLASAERIFEILDQQSNSESGRDVAVFSKEIRFEQLHFSFGDLPVLNNVDFVIQKGETIALVGASGSGKSTIADIICGFYSPASGVVKVDGKKLSSIDLSSWRSKISLVSQHPVLFDDSIRNNIVFGMENVSDDQLEKVVRESFSKEFINQMEHGLDTPIGTAGSRLSGGQRQRISIARAMLRNPDLLILDEATASLDAHSEQMVQKALKELMSGRTTLIIAHRFGAIQHADRILVMNKGVIEASGTHAELVSEKGLYAYLSQLQAF